MLIMRNDAVESPARRMKPSEEIALRRVAAKMKVWRPALRRVKHYNMKIVIEMKKRVIDHTFYMYSR